jgi:hypothetical protein
MLSRNNISFSTHVYPQQPKTKVQSMGDESNCSDDDKNPSTDKNQKQTYLGGFSIDNETITAALQLTTPAKVLSNTFQYQVLINQLKTEFQEHQHNDYDHDHAGTPSRTPLLTRFFIENDDDLKVVSKLTLALERNVLSFRMAKILKSIPQLIDSIINEGLSTLYTLLSLIDPNLAIQYRSVLGQIRLFLATIMSCQEDLEVIQSITSLHDLGEFVSTSIAHYRADSIVVDDDADEHHDNTANSSGHNDNNTHHKSQSSLSMDDDDDAVL